MPSWDPTQYERFADHRTRPFVDLLARVRTEAPRTVVDLGCGNGLATLLLAQRWPQARIVGIDSSAAMLAQAAAHDTANRVEWVEADVSQWNPRDQRPDVIVTNATLQWVPDHEPLIERWVSALPPGGAFAMQVPGNFTAHSHRIIREAVADHPRAADLSGLLRADPVRDPAGYAGVIGRHTADVDAWETTYLQLLDPVGAQAHPVLEWVKGTALRPIIEALTPEETESFLDDLARRLDAAYPRRPYGVPFPFRRVFAVAHIPGDAR
ncbi:methyltransferase domain-containing protein [Metallococcus carri]|uniref:methyltransferase domain-containing protein n=1 Tax=Metallococcus carri TaxID=1656884 RepID=UPI002E2D24C6|nr:methyltransferase domain-containing protein [Metallococcus carri]